MPPIEKAIRDCRFVQAFVVNGRKRRALDEYKDSAARLPELRLGTWQGLFRLLNAADFVSSRWSADLKTYLVGVGLDPFEGIGLRLAKPLEMRWVFGWHAQRGTMTFKEVAVWADPLRSGAVLKWRAQRASVSFRQVVQRNDGAGRLASLWRVSDAVDRASLSLRNLNMLGVAGARLPSLLEWRLLTRPSRRTKW